METPGTAGQRDALRAAGHTLENEVQDSHAQTEQVEGLAPRATFVFADLAGYTALTDVHGDEHGADVVADFCEHVERLLGSFGGEQIKAMGDAVMLRLPDPANAVRLSLALVHHEMRRPAHPMVRAGMDTGEAVERAGDWFGRTVNVAARVCGLARAGEVLITGTTRRDTADLAGVRFENRGSELLRNVRGAVQLYRVSCDHEHDDELVIDPVCRMAVDAGAPAERVVYEGRQYRFCSGECRQAFSRDPEFYAESHREQ